MFPLSNFLKTEVKDMAKRCGLERLTQKKESTGLCFVGKRDFQDFIKEVNIFLKLKGKINIFSFCCSILARNLESLWILIAIWWWVVMKVYISGR